MYEEKGELVIKTELTDVKKEDLDISLEGNTLTIKAKKKREEVSKGATYHSGERYFGHYHRSLLPPFHVRTDKVSTASKDGLWEIRLPKAEEVKS